jgi:hypothetical protein
LCYSLGTNVIEERFFCDEWLAEWALSQAFLFLQILSVIASNIILRSTTRHLVDFEKHPTKTARERALTLKLYIGLFLNSGIIIAAVNADGRN